MNAVSLSRISLVFLVASAVTAPAFAQDRTWNLNADGSWNSSANWDPADVPDTSGENAVITSPDGTTPVTVTLASNMTREVGDLTILGNGPNPDHTVVIPNNTFLDLHGDIQNDGVIALSSLGNATLLRLDGSDLTLSGAGVINLGAVSANAINNASGTNTLTNTATHTIAGGGVVGSNSIDLNNQGTIDANLTGVTMTIDPSSSVGANNTGVIRGSNGGIVLLTGSGGGEFANTGGVIEAVGTGSEVQLTTNAAITGGTVRSTGGGLVRLVANQNAFFTGVTFEGAIQSDNNTDFGVSGTITNNGTLTVNSLGNATDVELQDETTLQGGGTITLQGPVSRIVSVGGAHTLTNTDNTIQGAGNLGTNTTNLINNGLINANVAGQTLTIDPDASAGMVNNATVRASDGGIVLLTGSGGGEFTNTDSVIEAVGTGSEVQLTTNAAITGGTVRSTGGGLVRLVANQNAFFTNVTFAGEVRSDNNTDFGVSGTITNAGTITINSLGNFTLLELQAETTLQGGGRLTLQGSAAGVSSVGGSQTLTNSVSHLIEGEGLLGNNTTNLINNGLINANAAGQTLTIDPDASAGMVNNATVRASDGGIALLTGSGGGEFTNTDSVIEAVGTDSEVRLTTNAAITGGTVRSTGGGLVRLVANQNAFFTDVTFAGEARSENNTDFGVSGTITNNGTITINSLGNATDVELQAETTLQGAGTITLQGPVARISSAGGPQTLTNSAPHTIGGVGSIDTPTVNNGTIAGNSAAEPVEINQRLTGTGTLENVRIDNVHAPGDDVATVPLTGDYTIANTGELHIDIGGVTVGSEYDQLSSTGDITLNGDLVVLPIDLANGYTPAAGDEFTIITSTSPINGTFATESLPLVYRERVLLWDPVDYSEPTEVSLRIDVSVLGGDANDDGVVDLLDLDILGSNFGTSGAGGPSIGDFDFSGTVNLLDLDILGANFGFGTSVAVPEPSALLLCGVALIAARRGRR